MAHDLTLWKPVGKKKPQWLWQYNGFIGRLALLFLKPTPNTPGGLMILCLPGLFQGHHNFG
jgi:hypothetical protein